MKSIVWFVCGAKTLGMSTIAMGATLLDFDQEHGMFLARGYDTISGDVRGDCVSRTTPQPPAGVQAQRTTFALSQVENYSMLARQTGVSASASLTGGFGEASGKVAFMQSINVNDYSIYVLARVSVLNSSDSMVDMALNNTSRDILENQGEEQFRQLCGDAFVSGYTTGGELYSVIEIATHSDDEKKSIATSIGGSFGVFNGSASFQESLEKLNKINNINVYLYRVGDNGAIKITPAELVSEATMFPDKVKEGAGAYPVKATLMPYTNIPVPAKANLIDVRNQTDVVQRLSDERLTDVQQVVNIGYILNHPDEFVNVDAAALSKLSVSVSANINTITKAASACYQNYRMCVFPTDLVAVDFTMLPKRIAKSAQASDDAAKLAEEQKAEAEQREKAALEALAKAKKAADDAQAEADKEVTAAKKAEDDRAEAERKRQEAEKAAQDARDAQAKAERDRIAALEAAAKAKDEAARAGAAAAVTRGLNGPGLDISGFHINIR